MRESATTQPRIPEFFSLVCEVVRESLDFLGGLQSRGGDMPTHFYWPELSWLENGLPSFHVTGISSKEPDYGTALMPRLRGLFGPEEDDGFDLEQRPAFNSLLDCFKSHTDVLRYMVPHTEGEHSEGIWRLHIRHMITDLVDRYVHVYKEFIFSEGRLRDLYIPFEIGMTVGELPVDVAVPILFLNFQSETIEVSDRVEIFRMSDDFHLARADKRAYGPGVHDSVLAAATHALLLKGYTVRNWHWYWGTVRAASQTSAYPLHKIDTFFSALRVATGLDMGYAQLLLIPRGWAKSYRAHLPPLDGTSIRKYPVWFENFYWRRPVPVVDGQHLRDAGELYTQLWGQFKTNAGRRLQVATRRLNSCFLREDEEDAILDATIALEILLAPGDHQEITHKLAMRMAALSSLAKGLDDKPAEVYRNVKKIYKFRSTVAHGDVKASGTAREIKVSEKVKIPALELAVKYLRAAVRTLTKHPEYLTPSVIDENLLLGLLADGSEGGAN